VALLEYTTKNGSPVAPWVLQQMIDLQRHRGPVDQGIRLFSFTKSKGASYELSDGGSRDSTFEGGIGVNNLQISGGAQSCRVSCPTLLRRIKLP